MKKFIKKVIFFVVFCLAISVIPAYVLDPYNVFHWENMRNNRIEPNKNYIKTRYIISNPKKYNGFLLGSSRVGAIHVEKISNFKVYNMTYSSGTPKENLETLRTFIDNEVDIDIVYIGVDAFSYTEDPVSHYTQPIRCPYQQLNVGNFINLYMNPKMLFQSVSEITKGAGSDEASSGTDIFYEYGWWCDYNMPTMIDWSQATAALGGSYLLDETLYDIQTMKQLCEDSSIEFVVFTNPMCEITYRGAVDYQNYTEFLKRLAEITDYYNFSGINDISINTDNFIDTSHYNAEIGDMLIEIMCDGKAYDGLYQQGFGWYVTSENVDDLIGILQ